jgi:hypothetical protein
MVQRAYIHIHIYICIRSPAYGRKGLLQRRLHVGYRRIATAERRSYWLVKASLRRTIYVVCVVHVYVSRMHSIVLVDWQRLFWEEPSVCVYEARTCVCIIIIACRQCIASFLLTGRGFSEENHLCIVCKMRVCVSRMHEIALFDWQTLLRRTNCVRCIRFVYVSRICNIVFVGSWSISSAPLYSNGTHTHMFVHIHAYIHTHVHAHTHTHVCSRSLNCASG